MKKNHGVAYNGKVGAKMRPRKGPISSKTAPKTMFKCSGGPMNGHNLALQMDGGTLLICMKGQIGHYSRVAGGLLAWHPASLNLDMAA